MVELGQPFPGDKNGRYQCPACCAPRWLSGALVRANTSCPAEGTLTRRRLQPGRHGLCPPPDGMEDSVCNHLVTEQPAEKNPEIQEGVVNRTELGGQPGQLEEEEQSPRGECAQGEGAPRGEGA